MGVLQEILDWSRERPLWQQDALRRIVTGPGLTAVDIGELTTICLAQHGVVEPGQPPVTTTVLTQLDISAPARSAEPAELLSLGALEEVNAIASGQTMSFDPDGLTIVFGYNGSGKSGYARVLRAICRARYSGPAILPNAFQGHGESTPSATVEYRVGSDPRPGLRWRQGETPPAELRRISYFDSECANVHVNESNEIAFTPSGMDVLPKLVEACRAVATNIDGQITILERARPAWYARLDEFADTLVHQQLSSLTPGSDLDALRQLGTLTSNEEGRRTEIQQLLGADVGTRTRELGSRISSLRQLRRGADDVVAALSAESIDDIRSKLNDAVTKRAAATAAAQEAFGHQPLTGVGEAVWQQLWEAARRFSEHNAYPGQGFPNVGNGALCVLCLQPLDDEARQRLTNFDAFLKYDTERLARDAESILDGAIEPLARLSTGLSAYVAALPAAQVKDRELHRGIRRFHRTAWRLRRSIVESVANRAWMGILALPPSPAAGIEQAEQSLLDQVRALENASEKQYRAQLLAEDAELRARQWLSGILEDVVTDVERLKRLAALNAAKHDTTTNGITQQSSRLADRYVTEALERGLREELTTLGAAGLQVELDSPGGQLGQKRFRIALSGTDTPAGRVLSEGELRCVALAGFLAELATEDSGSALVFDDPVSSLDHRWKRLVAERLVDLAKQRQLIVFTHDLSFVSDLIALSENTRPPKHVHVYRGPTPGTCVDDVAWEAMTSRKRIGYLKQRHQGAAAIYSSAGEVEYAAVAKEIYALLRSSWEKAVEDVLLSGVVDRLTRDVHTKQLGQLTDISDDDIRIVNQAMTKTSRFIAGHDTPAAGAEPVPMPAELEQDIATLESWVASVRTRRRQ